MPSKHFPASHQRGAFPQEDLGKQTAPRAQTAPGWEECGERRRRGSLPPNQWARQNSSQHASQGHGGQQNSTPGGWAPGRGSGHPGFWSAPRDKTVNRSRPFSCESEGSHSDVKMSAKILPFTVYPKRLGNCWEVCGHSLGYFEQLRGDNHFWCRFPRSRGGISTEQRVA